MDRLTLAVTRVTCVACGDPLVTRVSNYCTVCLHNGELSRLGHAFFQRRGEYPDRMQMPESQDRQAGIGDFA